VTDDHHGAARRLSGKTAEAVADAMFALSTPSRVRILSHLRERPHTVSELMSALDMEQSAVSHQLRVLREYRLVVAERKGRQRVYALHDEHVASLLDEAIGHIAHLARPARRLAKRSARSAGAAPPASR
jgi:DNA-binding transcriptional ArsR family regulator